MYYLSLIHILLVNQLMDLRKNQEGKLKLHIAKTDMNLFLQEIYYAFNHLAAKKSIEFTFEKSEERMSAWFDKSIVEKVVFNLLSNAMKFTPNNGKVVFSLSRCTFAELPSEQQAELNKMPADTRFACLSVTDSGKGITEEDLSLIHI